MHYNCTASNKRTPMKQYITTDGLGHAFQCEYDSPQQAIKTHLHIVKTIKRPDYKGELIIKVSEVKYPKDKRLYAMRFVL